jgi:hypothetical protein
MVRRRGCREVMGFARAQPILPGSNIRKCRARLATKLGSTAASPKLADAWWEASSLAAAHEPPSKAGSDIARRMGWSFAKPINSSRTRSYGRDSLDHLVCGSEELVRDRQTECLGRPEIDQELILRGLLHGEIARDGPTQNTVDIGGRASVQIE